MKVNMKEIYFIIGENPSYRYFEHPIIFTSSYVSTLKEAEKLLLEIEDKYNNCMMDFYIAKIINIRK